MDPPAWHNGAVITSTPLYDGLLAEAFSRAHASEAGAALATAVALLHAAGPDGRCLGCGQAAPCPTTGLLTGALSPAAARAAVVVTLTAADPKRSEPDSSGSDRGDTDSDDPDRMSADERDGVTREAGVASLPTMPSAADIFAPNPAFNRALSVLLGG